MFVFGKLVLLYFCGARICANKTFVASLPLYYGDNKHKLLTD